MLTVHHLGISQSERIVWLCEELEIAYQLVRYERDPVTRLAPAKYKALSPFGTAPVITDGTVTLGESGAIVEYIIAKYGNGRLAVGVDKPNFADYLFWLHFANGSLMASGYVDLFVHASGGQDSLQEPLKTLHARGDLAHEVIEQRLGEMPYLAGREFTAADIMTFFSLSTMRAFVPRDLSGKPHIGAYIKRIAARPGYQRAMKKADPEMMPAVD